MNRRKLIAYAACAPMMFMGGSSVWASQGDFWSKPRSLWLRRQTNRGLEEVHAVYFADGKIIEPGYIQTCQILRDVTANQAVHMSPVLLDILCGLQGFALAHGYWAPLLTTSGYRNPRTNAAIEGAARNSFHTKGRAWDGRMPGIPADLLSRIAVYLRGGGVGLYQGRNFTHIDDGNLRFWRGR